MGSHATFVKMLKTQEIHTSTLSSRIKKSKFSSHATKNYENKCRLHEISRRIDWEGPRGPKIG